MYAEFRAKGLGTVHAGIKSLHASLTRLDAGFRTLGSVSTKAFIGLAAAATASVYAVMKSEKSLAMVSTMLDETSMRFLPKYKKGLRELSTSLGESGTTLAKGLYDILSASIDPAKAMDVLTVSAKAAAGGMTTTAVSADAITTILNSYKMSAEDAATVSDKLFATVKRGKLTYAELAGSIGKAAATSAIAGLSLDELLASIATITRAGINSDQAMTAVVGTIRSFLKPTSEAKKLAAELGFSMDTATLKAEGLSGVFKKLNGLTAEQLAELFPNIRGLKGVAAAMQDMTGFGYDLGLMANSAGMAQEAFGKMTKTASFQLGQMKEEIVGLAKDIGQQLLPVFRDLLKSLSGFIKSINPESAAKVIKWGLALAGVGIIVSKLALGIKALTSALLFLIANPIAAAIAAIAAALAAIIVLAETSMGPRPGQGGKSPEDILNEQRDRASKGQAIIAELNAINSKEVLTNTERLRAIELTAKLAQTYGSLGTAIDTSTGKVVGLVRATSLAEKKIAQQNSAALDQAIDVQQKEADRWNRYYEKSALGSTWVKRAFLTMISFGDLPFSEEGYKKRALEESDKLAALKKQRESTGPQAWVAQAWAEEQSRQKIAKLEDEIRYIRLHQRMSGSSMATAQGQIYSRQQQINQLRATLPAVPGPGLLPPATLPGQPVRTAQELESYQKQITANMSASQQAAQRMASLKYGANAGETLGLIIEANKVQKESRAQIDQINKDMAAGKFTEAEGEAMVNSIRDAAFAQLAPIRFRLSELLGEKGKEVKFDKGTWKGLADVWKDMQAAVLKRDPQTEELKKQTEYLKTLPKILEKIGITGAIAQ